VSKAPSKAVSFSRPKVGYFSNRPRTPVDRATGETETMMTHNSELEGETNKPERRHLYDNVRDKDPSKRDTLWRAHRPVQVVQRN